MSAGVQPPGDVAAYHVWAVVLLVRLAVVAGQVGLDLGTDTDTVTDLKKAVSTGNMSEVRLTTYLDGFDGAANLDGTTNHLVANTKRQGSLAPATCDGVDIRPAYTTS